MKKKQKIMVIVGPTASGKTSLAIKLAKNYCGEIISADSRQVYKGLDLGTGKVTKEEMCDIPHHLLDVADPRDTYTVADFVHDGEHAIKDIISRGNLPIIAGGTFFYIEALLGKISTPEVPPNRELREKLETLSLPELNSLLRQKDPERALTVDTENKRRVIRALEIADAIGTTPKTIQNEKYDVLTLGINIPREELSENIHTRLIERLEKGMIDEVKRLYENGLSFERMYELGLEYRYIAEYLQDKIGYDDMVETLYTKIRQFAKRQMTWLKRDTTIHWIDSSNLNNIHPNITTFLS